MAKKESTPARPEATMSVMEAIYKRHAIRSHAPKKVDEKTIKLLLDAAVHAPTAMHEEPWAFAIIQDEKTLKRISEIAKKMIPGTDEGGHNFERVLQPGFSIFYDAPALIVIYGKPMGGFVAADCWLAAENLMLAACSMDLGTCVIGLSVTALNSIELKEELGIPSGMTAYVPIIVGTPSGKIADVSRKEAEILLWK